MAEASNVLNDNMQVELDDLLGRMAERDLSFIFMVCRDEPKNNMIHMQAMTNALTEPSQEQIELSYKLLSLRYMDGDAYDKALMTFNLVVDGAIQEQVALRNTGSVQ